jgi:LysR family glycine cleavage system transcriptional activator
MIHPPSLETLRAFDAAYRHQSYARAAEQLGLTHAAISHRIRVLEERVGEVLFQRMGRQMRPTSAARRLIAQIKPALRTLELAFAAAPGADARPLVLSVMPQFASLWLVSRLGRFRRQQPNIAFDIVVDTGLADLAAGEADAAIRYGMGEWAGLISAKLADDAYFPVCSPDYLDGAEISSPADLSRCTLLRYSCQSWAFWAQAAGVELEEPRRGTLYSDSDLLLKAAEAGEGVALSRRYMAMDALAEGRLVRPFAVEVPDTHSYWLLRRAGHPRTAEIELFLSWLRDEARAAEASDRANISGQGADAALGASSLAG